MPTVIDLIEPALSMVRELFASPDSRAANLHDALAAMRAVRDCVELHRPPVYTEYALGRVADTVARVTGGKQATKQLDGRMCVGDPAQVQTLVRALLENAVLEHDAELEWTTEVDGDVPFFRLSIDGPGRFPESVNFGFGIALPFSTVEEQWTICTRGGRIDRSPSALALRLKGIRVVPQARTELAAMRDIVLPAEEKLRLLAGGESGLPREQAFREVCEAVEAALLKIDEGRKGREPGDLRAAIGDAMEQVAGQFADAGIKPDVTVAEDIPPILLRRNHIASAFLNAAYLAIDSLPKGGAFTIVADYQIAARSAEIVIAISGKHARTVASPFPASIRRAIMDIHGGSYEVSQDQDGVTLQLELPDTVGKILDAWIPGFEHFSARSKQFLRLLKSGGPTPPEEFILAGVLEEELERWLLPRLSVAPATTMAHDLANETHLLTGSIAERRSKALAQIARGRPKKEVCQPAYAAEILWAYRHDERHRKAVASERLSESVLKSLCEELLKPRIDYPAVLRIVASAIF